MRRSGGTQQMLSSATAFPLWCVCVCVHVCVVSRTHTHTKDTYVERAHACLAFDPWTPPTRAPPQTTHLSPASPDALRSQLLSVLALAREKDTVKEVPSLFVCPLTMEVYRDPAITPTGQSYERAAMLEHLSKVGAGFTGLGGGPHTAARHALSRTPKHPAQAPLKPC